MNFNKLVMGILSILAIVIMIVPAIAVHQIDARTTNQIIAIEGLYNDGDNILIKAPNYTDIESTYNCDYLGGDSGNDTGFINYRSGIGNDNCYMGNYITYIGDGNYTIIPDYTDNPVIPQTEGLIFAIPLEVTILQLQNADFLRINIDAELTGSYLEFTNDITGVKYIWESENTGVNESLFISSLIIDSWLSKSLNSTVYLRIGESYTNEFELEPVSIPFKLEMFELTAADSLEIQSTTLYFLTILSLNLMFTFAFIFTTDTVDIFIDKNRKNKR